METLEDHGEQGFRECGEIRGARSVRKAEGDAEVNQIREGVEESGCRLCMLWHGGWSSWLAWYAAAMHLGGAVEMHTFRDILEDRQFQLLQKR